MTETDALTVLQKLIVGHRGRERADRLLCTDAGGAQSVVEIKTKSRVSRYVELVASVAPVRIEAYAGKTLVGAWGERPAEPDVRGTNPKKPKTKPRDDSGAPPVPSRFRAVRAASDLAREVTTLLASAYKEHSAQLTATHKSSAERDTKIFDHVVVIAQHHSDRAAHAEARAAEAEKAVRIRDRQILELNGTLLRLQAKIAEVAAESNGDTKTMAFMQLLQTVATSPPAPATKSKTNGKAASA